MRRTLIRKGGETSSGPVSAFIDAKAMRKTGDGVSRPAPDHAANFRSPATQVSLTLISEIASKLTL